MPTSRSTQNWSNRWQSTISVKWSTCTSLRLTVHRRNTRVSTAILSRELAVWLTRIARSQLCEKSSCRLVKHVSQSYLLDCHILSLRRAKRSMVISASCCRAKSSPCNCLRSYRLTMSRLTQCRRSSKTISEWQSRIRSTHQVILKMMRVRKIRWRTLTQARSTSALMMATR